MRMLHLAFATTFAFAAAASSSRAAVVINEIGYDMPGTDDGKEFIELRGTPGESLDGLSYVTVEGDVGGNAGSIEQVIRLDGLTIGSNGLLLIRDSDAVLQPAPAAGTTVINRAADLAKDLENDTNNHLLVRNLIATVNPQNNGFNATTATDVDADDDGVIDAGFWDEIVDGVTLFENNGAEVSYAPQAANRGPQVAGFLPDFAVRLDDGQWIAVYANNGNAAGSGSGPYRLDNPGVEIRLFSTGEILDGSLLSDAQLTPGNANPSLVPEPAALAALAGTLGLVARRRRR